MPRFDYKCNHESCPMVGQAQEISFTADEVNAELHDNQLCGVCRSPLERLPHFGSTSTVIPTHWNEATHVKPPTRSIADETVRKTWDADCVTIKGSGKCLRKWDDSD